MECKIKKLRNTSRCGVMTTKDGIRSDKEDDVEPRQRGSVFGNWVDIRLIRDESAAEQSEWLYGFDVTC